MTSFRHRPSVKNQTSHIYAANTHTTDPGGRVPLFEDVCNAVRKQMKADNFLQ
jgi:hypothetical protein